jgi:hypothetical protein
MKVVCHLFRPKNLFRVLSLGLQSIDIDRAAEISPALIGINLGQQAKADIISGHRLWLQLLIEV